MSLSRKAINFDLSTNELKKHFNSTAEKCESSIIIYCNINLKNDTLIV